MKEISLVSKTLRPLLKSANPKLQKFIAHLVSINSKLQENEAKLHAEITSLNVKCELLQNRVNVLKAEKEENLKTKIDIKELLPEELERILNSRLERRAENAIALLTQKP